MEKHKLRVHRLLHVLPAIYMDILSCGHMKHACITFSLLEQLGRIRRAKNSHFRRIEHARILLACIS